MAKKQSSRGEAALVSAGPSILSGGAWAAQQLRAAIRAGQPLGPEHLRTLDTLSKDEWVQFDEVAIEESIIRLRGVGALRAAGLTIPIPNAMGKTILQYEKLGDMNAAEVDLSGLSRTEDDTVDLDLFSVALPMTHKDFNINLRTLEASRTRGESLDTTKARISSRKVSEMIEYMLFNGLTKKFGAASVYGLTTEPNRNVGSLGTTWVTESGENILAKVLAMIDVLVADGFYGPYWMFLPTAFGNALNRDFKANSDKSIIQRLREVEGLVNIIVADQMPALSVVIAQASKDVMAMGIGEEIQTIEWDQYGGMQMAFKIFAIQVPVIRSTRSLKSGVVHFS